MVNPREEDKEEGRGEWGAPGRKGGLIYLFTVSMTSINGTGKVVYKEEK